MAYPIKIIFTKISVAIILGLLFAILNLGEGFAAAPEGLGIEKSREELEKGDKLFEGNSVVLRIQKVLAAEGRYHGRLDGRMTDDLKAAIRVYQKRNRLLVDGKATKRLAKRMETHDKVQALLNKLEQARQNDLEKARLALLSNPLTKHLASKPDTEKANPTRDATACFSSPTATCLLFEAAESAKAIPKKDRRDWALGEILAAQTKAGLIRQAMVTVERISDLRLVVVALRNIAVQQANAGRQKEAHEAIAVIPDVSERLEAYVKITEIVLERYKQKKSSLEDINLAAQYVIENSNSSTDIDGVSALSRTVAVLAATKQKSKTNEILKLLEQKVDSFLPLEKRVDAYRHLSAAYAVMGNSAKALKALKRHSSGADTTSVLVAAAKAQLREGHPEEALNTAYGITADRYLSVLLTKIAVAQFDQGKFLEARGTLARAATKSLEIRLPFARSFALSKVALSWGVMGDSGKAVITAQEIKDERIKAQTMWSLLSLIKETEKRDQLEQNALDASNGIKSGFSRSWIFADAALSSFRDGKPEKARETFMTGIAIADTITNPWGRARILAKLANVLVELQ
ncbi:MAG: peptidoglycan-binding protein [Rhodospirillales bacterium]|nr:peptidoglycan-binding protein [Rhodospirillales bacterium]